MRSMSNKKVSLRKLLLVVLYVLLGAIALILLTILIIEFL